MSHDIDTVGLAAYNAARDAEWRARRAGAVGSRAAARLTRRANTAEDWRTDALALEAFRLLCALRAVETGEADARTMPDGPAAAIAGAVPA